MGFAALATLPLDALWMLDRRTLAPLLDSPSAAPPNSDYTPVLELGAERARFFGGDAAGTYSLAANRFRLTAALAGRRHPLADRATPATFVLEPIAAAARAGWLRHTMDNAYWLGDVPVPAYREPLERYRALRALLASAEPPEDWPAFIASVERLEADVHGPSAGHADSSFYAPIFRYLDAAGAPPAARAAVEFLHTLAIWDWPRAAAAGERLIDACENGEDWIRRERVREGTAVAYLKLGDVVRARAAFERVRAGARAEAQAEPRETLRERLLEAWIIAAETTED